MAKIEYNLGKQKRGKNMNLKIKDILNVTDGILIIGDENKECENFSKDTRTIQKGDTYIAIKGEKFDGNLFWKEALENGAETVIIEKINLEKNDIEKYKNKNIIQVENTKEALKQIATAKRKLYKNLIVIGVTGSSGKTSTKDIIANVLSKKFKTLKTEGNNNNDIGLPLTILRLRDHEAAVIEMGMNHLGEISELTKIAMPTISVITNIGTAHIGNLGSRENILKAKLEILEGMENPRIIINNDNDLLNKWYEENKEKIEIHTFGVENASECIAENIKKEENNIEFTCNFKNEKMKINVPVGNSVFVLNSLCAVLVGKLLNLSNDEINSGIGTFELTKKRMEIIKLKNDITLINDSYNANFDSMVATIKYLSEFNKNRKIAVLGDMYELGDFSEELHRKVGVEIPKNKIDLLILVGNYSKFIKLAAIENGMAEKNILQFNSNEELLTAIKNIMKDGDVILFKASNAMKLFNVVEKLK
jgi:UDP-N-acetylmuramoyl-tripeptide--D-alanyl-D-alanine ligase